MKLRNMFISAGLLLASGVCAFTGALVSKKELVKTSAASVSTITIDTFSGLRETFPMGESATVDLEGYTFKYKNVVSNPYFGYGSNEALSFYNQETRFFNNQTAMPGDIKSIELHTHSAQKLTITYNVRFGTSAFVGMGTGGDSYSMYGSESHTFTNSVTGATFFSISCDGYTLSREKASCIDKIVISYTVDQAKTDATTFAQTFKDTTDGICKDTSKGPTDTDLDDLAAVWNAKEDPDGTSLVEKWNALSSGAKAVFTTGTANATIADAKARYVHIMSRYSGTLDEFADGPTYSSNMILANRNNTEVIAVVITVTSILSLTVVGTYFSLKKRHN